MATYTDLDDINLPAVTMRYGLYNPDVAPLTGGMANSSFHVSADAGEFVLTVLDNQDHTGARELADRTQALFHRGVPTTEVIPDAQGLLVSVIDGRPVMLKRWIPGEVQDPLPGDLLPAAGRLLAKLHGVPTDVPGLPTRTRRLSVELEAEIAHFPDRDFAGWLTRRLEQVHAYEADTAGSAVVIHGDLFADNLVVTPQRGLAVLDWETASLDDPLLDLGMAIVGLARIDGQIVPHRAQHLIRGYTNLRPLGAEELAAVVNETEHAALIIAFHRYYRHNMRFPDPQKAHIHQELVSFVDSLDHLDLTT